MRRVPAFVFAALALHAPLAAAQVPDPPAPAAALPAPADPEAPPAAPADAAARAQALLATEGFGCYGVARGRASLPVRENYLTYSAVVDTIPRAKVFIGQRVQGENKVLVFTPHAEDWIGIARHSFTMAVPAARCAGEALYQPAYAELRQWVRPRPGELEAPRPPGERRGSWGCFAAKGRVALPFSGLGDGQRFFAERVDVDGRYTGKLRVLDGWSGEVIGEVSLGRAELVPVSECGGDAAFGLPHGTGSAPEIPAEP